MAAVRVRWQQAEHARWRNSAAALANAIEAGCLSALSLSRTLSEQAREGVHAQWETDRERASERGRERAREWERVRARRQSLASAESHIACELPKCVLHFYLLCFPFLLSLSLTLSRSPSLSPLFCSSLAFVLSALYAKCFKCISIENCCD